MKQIKMKWSLKVALLAVMPLWGITLINPIVVQAVSYISITANPKSITADGISSSDLTIYVRSEPAVSGPVTVTLSVSGPGVVNPASVAVNFTTVNSSSGTAYSEGWSSSRLYSTTTPGTILVTASADGFVSGSENVYSVEKDSDKDGVPDSRDNCPSAYNSDQRDSDGDGVGDVCDSDLDGDGVPNARDNCPAISNPNQRDRDGDGYGDACDAFPTNRKKH